MPRELHCDLFFRISFGNGILLPKLFWPVTVRKKCSSDREKLKIRGRRPRLLEKFIQAVKGQNNLWSHNTFFTCSWRFIRYQILWNNYPSNWKKKLLGFRNMQEKFENYFCSIWINDRGLPILRALLNILAKCSMGYFYSRGYIYSGD